MNGYPWSPDENGLKKVVQVLGLCLKGNQLVQSQVKGQLQHFRSNMPFFNNYLCYVCVKLKSTSLEIRQLAGVLLKNSFRQIYINDRKEISVNYIKRLLIEGLCDNERLIRSTVSSAISSFVRLHKINSWPTLFQTLVYLFNNNQNKPLLHEGIIFCIRLIIEDNHENIEQINIGNCLNVIVPMLIKLFRHQNVKVRQHSILSMILLLSQNILPNSFVVNIKEFFNGLSLLAKDKDAKVRSYVCRSFIFLLKHPTYLEPLMKSVIPFVVACSADDSNDLAFEAAEFWNSLAFSPEKGKFLPYVKPFLRQIIPLLIKQMVYDEFNRNFIQEEMKRETEMDNIPPRFAQTRSLGMKDDEEGEDIHYFDIGSEWTLRRCSSSALDALTSPFGNIVLPIAFQHIKLRIQPKNAWWIVESGLLALGAVAKGGMHVLVQNNEVPNLVMFLLNVMKGSKSPMVSATSLWTLGRFAKWMVKQKDQKFLEVALKEILTKLVHKNGHIQESSCSCLAVFEEEAGFSLAPYMGQIIGAFNVALKIYRKRNLIFLYDTISTFADYLTHHIKRNDFFELVLKQVFVHWSQIKSIDDEVLVSLLECVSSISLAVKEGSVKYVRFVWNKCLDLIQSTYRMIEIAKQEDKTVPSKDGMIASLDTLNAFVEALGKNTHSLVDNRFLTILGRCMKDNNHHVKTVCYGMIGDIARNCYGRISQFLNKHIQLLIADVEPTVTFSVMNNSVWAIGLIGLQGDKGMLNVLRVIVEKIVRLLQIQDLKESLLQNCILTLGRLSIKFPKEMSEYFGHFSKRYAMTLIRIKDIDEREHAFKGLHGLIMSGGNKQQKTIAQIFPYVLTAIASYEVPAPPDDLKKNLHQILMGYKHGFKQDWQKYYQMIPIPTRNKLQSLYGFS